MAARQIAYIYVNWGEIDRYRHSNYGFTDFVQPEVFDRLVAEGVLEPLPPIKGHPGRGYRVKAEAKASVGVRQCEAAIRRPSMLRTPLASISSPTAIVRSGAIA